MFPQLRSRYSKTSTYFFVHLGLLASCGLAGEYILNILRTF